MAGPLDIDEWKVIERVASRECRKGIKRRAKSTIKTADGQIKPQNVSKEIRRRWGWAEISQKEKKKQASSQTHTPHNNVNNQQEIEANSWPFHLGWINWQIRSKSIHQSPKTAKEKNEANKHTTQNIKKGFSDCFYRFFICDGQHPFLFGKSGPLWRHVRLFFPFLRVYTGQTQRPKSRPFILFLKEVKGAWTKSDENWQTHVKK